MTKSVHNCVDINQGNSTGKRKVIANALKAKGNRRGKTGDIQFVCICMMLMNVVNEYSCMQG